MPLFAHAALTWTSPQRLPAYLAREPVSQPSQHVQWHKASLISVFANCNDPCVSLVCAHCALVVSQKKNADPLTNDPLRMGQLRPNNNLRSAAHKYLEDNPWVWAS